MTTGKETCSDASLAFTKSETLSDLFFHHNFWYHSTVSGFAAKGSLYAPRLTAENTLAFGRSETLTLNSHAKSSRVKKTGVESRSDCGAETSVHAGRTGTNRSQTVARAELARPGVAKFWAGYDVPRQRPAGDTSLAGLLPAGDNPHDDCPAPAKDPSHRQSGADTPDTRLFATMDQDQRQAGRGLRVHAAETGQRQTDHAGALRRHNQDVGALARPRTGRVFEPLDPAQQTVPHVLGGRGHCPDFAATGAQVDRQHHRVPGYHPTQGRGSGAAAFNDARFWRPIGAKFLGLLPSYGKKSPGGGEFRLVKFDLRQVFFCQPNLTEKDVSVENRVNSISSKKMGQFGKLAGVATLAAALSGEPVLAEDNAAVLHQAAMTNEQVTDCVGFVREQRDLARATGITMSRRDQTQLLDQCESGLLQDRIAEQERIIAVLNERIAHLRLRIDANNQLIDENNQVIAFLVAINGQWVIQRQLEAEIVEIDENIDQMLREAEQIIQSLPTS